ncbi:MAG: glycosyltransferase [Candidatus Fermentimicrarchaeum limneticum]|uniref:Glycosyltransferase n=1 Tax=Fermentimicrarchaeum limneticum TaxID=2795018 RepID=A0A7D6BTH8_FERL1|nr:MAG: glycosyltransferase [Candidatus Fermentimicrarchaeum limneticum]
MDRDLVTRWLLAIAIMASGIAGMNFGVYLLRYIVVTPAEIVLSLIFLLLVTSNTVFNTFGCYYYLRSYGLNTFIPKKLRTYPRVAVAIPTRNEDEQMVKRNLESITRLDYPKDKLRIFLLDNSTNRSEELEKFCKKLGVNYVYMENPAKLKSYVMNKFLDMVDEEYVAIFDADEYLTDPSFLKETLPCLDGNAGFVQTEKQFAPGSFFANGVNTYYSFFYKFMQPVRNLCRSTMFCGSCGVVRRSVVKQVGGFPATPTEDAAFAFKADLAGRGGVFVLKTYALGEAIEHFETFLSQQWRYTIGNIWILIEYLQNFFKLKAEKHIHYLAQTFGYAYLSSLFIFYSLLSIIFVISDITLRSINSQVFLPQHLKMFAASYMIAIFLLVVVGGRLYFGSFRLGIMAMFLNFSTAFVRTKAMIVGFLNFRPRFIMSRQSKFKHSIIEVLKANLIETSYSVVLLSLSLVSFLRNDVVSAFWLFWYSTLFFCSFLFSYGTEVKQLF